MMRLAEIGLFAAPFLVFFAWWFLARGGLSAGSGPPPMLVIVVVVGVIVMAVALFIFHGEDTAPVGSTYTPARELNGRIIPGHLTPPRETR
jgi:Family of unknown function (DUF6111)